MVGLTMGSGSSQICLWYLLSSVPDEIRANLGDPGCGKQGILRAAPRHRGTAEITGSRVPTTPPPEVVSKTGSFVEGGGNVHETNVIR